MYEYLRLPGVQGSSTAYSDASAFLVWSWGGGVCLVWFGFGGGVGRVWVLLVFGVFFVMHDIQEASGTQNE